MSGSSVRLLVTRPQEQGQAFAEAVARAYPGVFAPVFFPLTRIVPEVVTVSLDGIQALLFSSANGVRAFAAAHARRDLPALCVGSSTAAAAAAEGFPAESAEGDAGALARMAVRAWVPGDGDYLHVRGRDTVGDLPAALAAEGVPVREVILYDARPAAMVPLPIARDLETGRIALCTFFSPRAAQIFVGFAAEAAERGTPWPLHQSGALCISRAAAEPLLPLRFGATVQAAQPDRRGMVEAMGQFVAA